MANPAPVQESRLSRLRAARGQSAEPVSRLGAMRARRSQATNEAASLPAAPATGSPVRLSLDVMTPGGIKATDATGSRSATAEDFQGARAGQEYMQQGIKQTDDYLPLSNGNDLTTKAMSGAYGVLQGATFGHAPEVAALPAMIPGGDTYDERVQLKRDAARDYKAAAPASYFAGEAVGFGAPGGIAMKGVNAVAKPVVAAATRLAPVAGGAARLGTAATVGAVDGALFGAGAGASDEAMNEGRASTLEERAETAEDFAKIGAAFGGGLKVAEPVIRPVARAAGTGLAWIGEKTGIAPGAMERNAAKIGAGAVTRDLERAGILTLDDLMKRAAKYGDKPVVLADLSQPTTNTLTALVRRPGTTAEKAQAVLQDRVAGLPGRMLRDIAEETGLEPAAVYGQIEEMIKAGRAKAAPKYDAAFEAPFAETANLERITQAPVIQGMAKTARGRVDNQAIDQIGSRFDDGVPTGENIRGGISGDSAMPPLKFYDEMKQLLDEEINARLANGQGIDDIEAIRKALVNELDLISAQAATGIEEAPLGASLYKAARDAGGDAPQVRQAFEDGKRALGAKDSYEIEAQIKELNEGQLTPFQSGTVMRLLRQVEQGSLTPRQVHQLGFQRKMRAIFGEKPGNALIERLKVEAELVQKGSRWNPNVGSVTSTAMMGEPSKAGDEIMRAGANALTGNKVGLMVQAINLLRRQGYSEAQLNAIGDLLLSSPKDAAKILFPQGVPKPLAPLFSDPGGGGNPPSGGSSNALSNGLKASTSTNALSRTEPLTNALDPAAPTPIVRNGFGFGFGGGKKPPEPRANVTKLNPPKSEKQQLEDALKGYIERESNPTRAQAKAQKMLERGEVLPSEYDWLVAGGKLEDAKEAQQNMLSAMAAADDATLRKAIDGDRRFRLIMEMVAEGGDKRAQSLMYENERVRMAPGEAQRLWRYMASNKSDFDFYGLGTLFDRSNRLGDELAVMAAKEVAKASGNPFLAKSAQRITTPQEARAFLSELHQRVSSGEMPEGKALVNDALNYKGVFAKAPRKEPPAAKPTAEVVPFQRPPAGEPPKKMGFGLPSKRPENLSSGEAKEWAAAEAKGLPMDKASRMARAKAMGFDTDTVLYHGTTAKEKIIETGFSKKWTHLTDSKSVADSYQAWDRGGDPGTLELITRVKNPAYFDARGQKYTDIANRIYSATWDAEKAGHDALIINGVRDNYDSSIPIKPHKTVVIFDPANIRSVNAAFDPDNAGSSALLAGMPSPALSFAERRPGVAGAIGANLLPTPADLNGDGKVEPGEVAASVILKSAGGAVAGKATAAMARKGGTGSEAAANGFGSKPTNTLSKASRGAPSNALSRREQQIEELSDLPGMIAKEFRARIQRQAAVGDIEALRETAAYAKGEEFAGDPRMAQVAQEAERTIAQLSNDPTLKYAARADEARRMYGAKGKDLDYAMGSLIDGALADGVFPRALSQRLKLSETDMQRSLDHFRRQNAIEQGLPKPKLRNGLRP